MDDTEKFLIVIIVYLVGSISIIGLAFSYSNGIIQTKNSICNTLELGKYSEDKTNNKDIEGIHYFKCTKEIYNSTTREIITIEKWVRLP